MEPTTAHTGRWPLATTGWAAFLGCSWTWCIGMFLPVLLVRDLGIWGWVVFAVPNVLGAAAMGWVLRKPADSARLVREHGAACFAFSAVTIALHVFFVIWFIPRLVGLPIAGVTFLIATVYLIATALRPAWDLPAAAIVWAISLAAFALFMRRWGPIQVPTAGTLGPLQSAWLAPVCAFGFIFCPYLDLTFHRAREATDFREARIAFSLGFGVVFFAMIVFSLFYATSLAPLVGPEWRAHLLPVFGPILAAHMIAQTAFTLSAHARSILLSRARAGSIFGMLIAAQIALFLGIASWMLPRYHGMDFGELVYRLFMAFYGLLFPAYVWVCMVRLRVLGSGLTAVRLRALLLGVAVAAPMYWMGFVEGKMVWLVPGLLVVLLSKFTVPRRAAVMSY